LAPGHQLGIGEGIEILRSYAGAARPMIPRLRELEKQLRAHREARGLAKQIEEVRKTSDAIETAPDGGPLRGLAD